MSDDVTIKISNDTFEFLKALHEELVTQDTRSTANPRYYVVEEEIMKGGYEVGSTIEGDRWYKSDSCEKCLYTKEEACKKAGVVLSSPYWQQELNKKGWELTGVRNLKIRSNAFLTEKAILHHIKINSHNLINPTTFLTYAFRNPELLGVINAIIEIGEKNA